MSPRRKAAEAGPEKDVLAAADLARGPSRPPDRTLENDVLVALAADMAVDPGTLWQKLTQSVLLLCRADSAAVCTLKSRCKEDIFVWHAISGAMEGQILGGIPREECPAGTVLDRNQPLLFSNPGRLFPRCQEWDPAIHEALIVPFHVNGRPIGALWAIAHSAEACFEAEDVRLLTQLTGFAGAAYNLGERIRTLKEVSTQHIASFNLLQDIDKARKEAESASDALRENQRHMQELLALVPVGIYRCDAKGRVVYVNRKAAEMWGSEPVSGIVGEKLSALLKLWHADDTVISPDEAPLTRILKEGRSLRNIEITMEQPQGRRIAASLNGDPIRDANGRIVGAIIALLDTSGQKRAEGELLKSENQSRMAVDAAKMGTWEWDLTTDEIHWNAQHFRLLGLDPEGSPLSVADFAECVHPEDQGWLSELLKRSANRKIRFHAEYRIRRADGSERWLSGQGRVTGMSGNRATKMSGVTFDITERKLNETALQQALHEKEKARRDLAAANKAKDRFLAVLSHELRTPLTPVLMTLSILQRRKDLDADLVGQLEMIRRNVTLECHLVEDLLDVTRVVHGKLEIDRKPLDLHEVIHNAVQVSKSDLDQKKQVLDLSLEASNSCLWGDGFRFQQTFWNLLKNASKFTPKAGHVRLSTRNENDHIVVELSDSGVGIPADKLTLIFDEFSQASESVIREFGGLGIGLAIAKSTIEAHGGTIQAVSDGAGCGATFIVDLPLNPPEPIK